MADYGSLPGASPKTGAALRKLKSGRGRLLGTFAAAWDGKDALLLGVTLTARDPDGRKAAKLVNKAARTAFGITGTARLCRGAVVLDGKTLVFHVLEQKGLSPIQLRKRLRALATAYDDLALLARCEAIPSTAEAVTGAAERAARGEEAPDTSALDETEAAEVRDLLKTQPDLVSQVQRVSAGRLDPDELEDTVLKARRQGVRAVKAAKTPRERVQGYAALAMTEAFGPDPTESGALDEGLLLLVRFDPTSVDRATLQELAQTAQRLRPPTS